MKFEYKILSTTQIIRNRSMLKPKLEFNDEKIIKIEKYLDELGKQRWELVSVSISAYGGTTSDNIYHFKRELVETKPYSKENLSPDDLMD